MGEFDEYVAAHRARREEAERSLETRRSAAREAAVAAARLLAQQYPIRRAVLFGSVVSGRFREDSDIDLAVEGLPEGTYFAASALVAKQCPFEIELVRTEDAPTYIKEAIEQGECIWPR